MEKGSLKRFRDRITKKKRQSLPFRVGIEITYRCNLNCKFCYISDEAKQKPDISSGRLFPIIDQIADAGGFLISLLGGEPFVREDFLEIYEYIIRKGLFVTIFTNGTIINPSILDYLEEYQPHRIIVSLYAGSKKGYEKISGSKNAFNLIIRFTKILKERKLSFGFSSLINKLNIDEFDKILDLAEEFDIPLTYGIKIGPRIDKDKVPCHLRLSREERKRVFNLAKGRNAIRMSLGEGLTDELFCDGMFLIDNFGKLVLCIIQRDKYFDLNQVSFKEALLNLKDIRQKCPCK